MLSSSLIFIAISVYNAASVGYIVFPRCSLFLTRYQINHVKMKMGRMSAPGTSSNRDTTPTQRNMTKQATIPTMSRKSPTTGRSKSVTIYSLMSNTMQTTRENNSFWVRTKYCGEDLNPSSRRPKSHSSRLLFQSFYLFWRSIISSFRACIRVHLSAIGFNTRTPIRQMTKELNGPQCTH